MFQQGSLHCEVCNAQLQNFDSMEWHIKGKRHQNAIEYWKTRKDSAKYSVFVRGFPIGTTEQELWTYFCGFGPVTKVALVKPKNLFAIIEFKSPETAKRVLHTPGHRLNSQALTVKPREVEVPGQLPRNQYDQGYSQFHRGGSLQMDRWAMGPNFRGRGGPPMGRGLMHQGRGGGRGGHQAGPSQIPHGNVEWFEERFPEEGPGGSKKKRKANLDDELDMYYHEELMEKLVKVKGVQNQLEWLCQTLQVTAEEAQSKFTLCEKLQECLGRFFPGCTVNQFGSSVNGFGLSGCDMDIFLDLSTMHGRTWELQPIRLPFVRDFKFLKDKEWGPLIPKDLEMMGLGDQCKLISRILIDNMEGVSDVQGIPSNRCPIVRFRCTGLDTKCDLSVNNKMALQNTKLLYLCSVLNSRVRLLVYAIRYWGKVKGIAGNNQSSTKLSNYALTLMVLNYLQNVDPPVLPTIERLSLLHGPSNRMKIEGWDTTFAMDWQIIPQSGNAQTAAELLSGFFSYWSAFNFTDNILITRTASDMLFTDFYDKNKMPDGRLRSFKAASINIQDPFVLNHNISHNVNEKMRDTVIRELRIAAIKSSMWGNDAFNRPAGGGDLVHLLNSEIPDLILQEDEEKRSQVMEKGRMPARTDGEFTFMIELNPKQLSNKVLKNLQKGDNFRAEWCKRTCLFVYRILKEVLLLNIEELPDGTDEDRQKVEDELKKKRAADQRNRDIKKRREEKIRAKKQMLKDIFDEKKRMEKEEMEKKERESAAREAAQGGAMKGGKRLVPMSILEINPRDTRKRLKLVEEEFDWDQHVEISDDEEEQEVIEYKPDVPGIRYKRESNAEINMQYFIRAWCMTWARRKKCKNFLVNQEGRKDEGLPMEKLISDAIWQNDNAPLKRPIVGFYCYMESVLEGSETKVSVSMQCREGERDFNTFFQFTKMYLYKMIEKYFN